MTRRPLLRAVPFLAVPWALGACAAVSSNSASNSGAWRERLIEPLTQPTIFESPVIDSQLRAIVLDHGIPSDSGLGGGDITVYALQARYALTPRLALIAVKDGYVDVNLDSGADETGWADIAGGAKYAFVDDPEAGMLVTGGLVYEFANGDEEVFQGNGDGLVRPFVSAGWDRGELNVLAALGFNLPLDADEESTSYDYHLHVSYEVAPNVFPLVELSGITWTDNGSALGVDFEGGDLINLGATNADGSVLSGAIGLRYRAGDSYSFGVGYETALSSREDLLDDRLTIDAIWSF